MSEPFETHRGSVRAWECDGFGHFTVAYYFARFGEASAAALAILRERGRLPPAERWHAAHYLARFERELRAGDGLHIESSLVEASAGRLRLGHRVVNSISGETATTVEEALVTTPEERAPPESGKGFMASARDVVQPAEVDTGGGLALAGHIHRTSAGSMQLLGAIGITPDYLRTAGRGFATFEIRLELHGPRPRAGARLRLESALSRLGSSSLEMLHRLYDASSGRLVASASQAGAHFDLSTRRSTPIPPELREKAAAYLVGKEG